MHSELGALISVIIVDLMLAGDNAIVVGMAAAGLPNAQRRKTIIVGIGAAALLRIVFAFFTTGLLNVVGLLIVGGFLLLWVCWKLWREIHAAHFPSAQDTIVAAESGRAIEAKPKTFGQALTQIVVADVSMSLDNVLAVAGIARRHPWVLVIGLALSVALMGVAANFLAKLLKRMPWISYAGLFVIAWVALLMIWQGAWQAWNATADLFGQPPPA